MSVTYTQNVPVLYGRGAVNELGDKLKELGGTKVFCVYDQGVAKSGIADKILKILKDAGLETIIFDKVGFEAPDTEVDANAKYARENGADCVIGIGGGSCLDSSKFYAVLLKNAPPVTQYFAQDVGRLPHAPIVLIPTCSGTGSEVTGHGVVWDTKKNRKEAVLCFGDLAILDPELMVTAPPKVTASTGMDAMCHAVEGYTSSNHNPRSDVLALNAVGRISRNLERAFKNGNDIDARDEMALGSNFAGIAFNDADVHFGHAIAHAFGVEFKMAHGVACALVLPEIIAFSAKVDPKRAQDIADALGVQVKSDAGEEAAAFVRDLMRRLEIPTLASLGHSREACIATAKYAMTEWFVIRSPFPVDLAKMEEIAAATYDNYQ